MSKNNLWHYFKEKFNLNDILNIKIIKFKKQVLIIILKTCFYLYFRKIGLKKGQFIRKNIFQIKYPFLSFFVKTDDYNQSFRLK
jgi:hypothetical protein